jgi:hypothetical protein
MHCDHLDVKERVKLFGMAYDVLMTAALCLQTEWIYVMEYIAGGDMRALFKKTQQFSEETVELRHRS